MPKDKKEEGLVVAETRPTRHGSRARSRIDHVVHLMSTGKWVRGKSAEQLQAEYGVSRQAVSAYAQAASYYLDRIGARDEVIEEVREHLLAWVRDGGLDRVQAAQTLLKSLGALTEKIDHTHRVGQLDDERLLERMCECFRRPDPLTAEALRLTGWTRLETTGETINGEEETDDGTE